jgi:hypothetical protein
MSLKKQLRKLIEERPLKKDRFEATLFYHCHNILIPGTVHPEILKILNKVSAMFLIIRDSGRAIKKNCLMDGHSRVKK